MNRDATTPKRIKNPELRSHLMKEMWRKIRKAEGAPPSKKKPVAKVAKVPFPKKASVANVAGRMKKVEKPNKVNTLP